MSKAKEGESPNLGKLREISRAAIGGLLELKEEYDRLEGFLAKMDGIEEKGADRLVFDKVRSDYLGRENDLLRRAEPIVTEARKSLQDFCSLHEELVHAFDRSRQDKTELEIRHAVGEFSDEDMREKMSGIQSEFTQWETEVREADELKERFLAAFPEGMEFPVSRAKSTTPGSAKPHGPSPIEPPVADRTVVIDDTGPHEMAASGAVDESPGASQTVGRTLIIPPARLLAKDSGQEYPLGASMSIGRDGDNQIRLEEAGVSRKHATVVFGSGGFTIKDEQSHFGTFVNDEKIKKRRLSDGDQVRIGAVQMVFQYPGASKKSGKASASGSGRGRGQRR